MDEQEGRVCVTSSSYRRINKHVTNGMMQGTSALLPLPETREKSCRKKEGIPLQRERKRNSREKLSISFLIDEPRYSESDY